MTIRPTTHAGYKQIVETHIVPRIGDVALQKLTPVHLNAFYAELLTDGRLTDGGDRGTGLSSKSVHNVHAVIRRALNDGVRWGVLARNVAQQADPPKVRTTTADTMHTGTGDELKQFLGSLEDDRLGPLWTLLAATGSGAAKHSG